MRVIFLYVIYEWYLMYYLFFFLFKSESGARVINLIYLVFSSANSHIQREANIICRFLRCELIKSHLAWFVSLVAVSSSLRYMRIIIACLVRAHASRAGFESITFSSGFLQLGVDATFSMARASFGSGQTAKILFDRKFVTVFYYFHFTEVLTTLSYFLRFSYLLIHLGIISADIVQCQFSLFFLNNR